MITLIDYPAGYQIHVTTWENDGDHYETKIISGLAYEDVKFYQELTGKFTSRNNRNDPGFGNEFHDEETLLEVFGEVLVNHPNISDTLRDEILDAEDDVFGLFFYNFLGDPVDYDHGFCRVVEDFKVFSITEPILVQYQEPDNVTKDFTK